MAYLQLAVIAILALSCFASFNGELLHPPVAGLPPKPPKSAQPDPPQNATCPEGFKYFAPTDACYGRPPSLGYGWGLWDDAEQLCEKLGGHLPSIHSQAEAELVGSSPPIRWYVWTGLYSNDNLYTWKWSDGTPFDYKPWWGIYGNVSSCAFLSGSVLVNGPCLEGQYFICKVPTLKGCPSSA